MADNMIGPDLDTNWVDKRFVPGSGASVISAPGDFQSITTMRARLTAISSTTYSAARLNTMSVNDMVYACRLNDEAGGI